MANCQRGALHNETKLFQTECDVMMSLTNIYIRYPAYVYLILRQEY